MVKRRLIREKTVRVDSVSGGLLRKVDETKISTKFARDVRNMRFRTGAVECREGHAILDTLTRPAGALVFPGTATQYLEIPENGGSPIWTGLKDFTLELTFRPVSNPAPAADVFLLNLGESGVIHTLAIKNPSATPLKMQLVYRDADDTVDQTFDMGNLDDDGGGTDPADRRYYLCIRRRGQQLDSFLLGAATGSQYKLDETAFSAVTTLMRAPTKSLFVGGLGPDGTEKGMNARVSMIRLTGRYVPLTRKLYWTGHPAMEDQDNLLSLMFTRGTSSLEPDESLYENHAEVNGVIASGTDDKQALMVGQFIGEFSKLGSLERVIAAGGDIFMEEVR